MEPGAGRRTTFDARSRAGFGGIVWRLLAADLRISATERLFGAGGRRPDTELLRPAPGEESSAGRKSRARQVSIVSACVAQTFSRQRMDFSTSRIPSGRGTSVLVPQSNSREGFRSVYGFIEL